MAERFAIIGAGIVGVTLARALQKKFPKAKISVFEATKGLGAHASGRNSGVLHSGIYYPPETLKAKFCRDGGRAMAEYCQHRQLPILNCGKLIVPTTSEKVQTLETLMAYADGNGVKAVLISKRELLAMEPHARPAPRAIFCPETSVIDPLSTLKALAQDAAKEGVQFQMNTPVQQVKGESNGSLALTVLGDGVLSETRVDYLFNCAGAWADVFSHQLKVGEDLGLIPFRGSYLKLRKEDLPTIKHNLYPVPDLSMPFLGLHFTPSVDGDIYVGPTALPALGPANYFGLKGLETRALYRLVSTLFWQYVKNTQNIRSHVHKELQKLTKKGFYREAQRLLPGLRPQQLLTSPKRGIRPQLVDLESGRLIMDFCVKRGKNSCHVLNAISPAFTCSLEFANYLLEEL
jgi:(S)-2-hydroxyglutarate dehydrogenase